MHGMVLRKMMRLSCRQISNQQSQPPIPASLNWGGLQIFNICSSFKAASGSVPNRMSVYEYIYIYIYMHSYSLQKVSPFRYANSTMVRLGRLADSSCCCRFTCRVRSWRFCWDGGESGHPKHPF